MRRALHSIEIQKTEFLNSHGHDPRGRGCWLFEFLRDGEVVEGPWGWGWSGTYTDALKAAKKHARDIGADAINVCP